jgi:hypothetical protein
MRADMATTAMAVKRRVVAFAALAACCTSSADVTSGPDFSNSL